VEEKPRVFQKCDAALHGKKRRRNASMNNNHGKFRNKFVLE